MPSSPKGRPIECKTSSQSDEHAVIFVPREANTGRDATAGELLHDRAKMEATTAVMLGVVHKPSGANFSTAFCQVVGIAGCTEAQDRRLCGLGLFRARDGALDYSSVWDQGARRSPPCFDGDG